MRQKLATFWQNIEEPLQGAKITVMDIIEFKDINEGWNMD